MAKGNEIRYEVYSNLHLRLVLEMAFDTPHLCIRSLLYLLLRLPEALGVQSAGERLNPTTTALKTESDPEDPFSNLHSICRPSGKAYSQLREESGG